MINRYEWLIMLIKDLHLWKNKKRRLPAAVFHAVTIQGSEHFDGLADRAVVGRVYDADGRGPALRPDEWSRIDGAGRAPAR